MLPKNYNDGNASKERQNTMILKPNNGLALEPLQVPIGQKITKMKTQDNDQYQNQTAESPRLRTNEQIEDISDGETLDNQHSNQIG